MADIGMFGKTREPSSHIVWSEAPAWHCLRLLATGVSIRSCSSEAVEATPEQLAELMMQVRRDFGGGALSKGDQRGQSGIFGGAHFVLWSCHQRGFRLQVG